MTTTYNLKPMDSHKSFYGKAKVEERDDGSKVLYSYGMPVCGLTVTGRFFRAWGGYSATTMRHVNSFLEAEGMNGGGQITFGFDAAEAEEASRRHAEEQRREAEERLERKRKWAAWARENAPEKLARRIERYQAKIADLREAVEDNRQDLREEEAAGNPEYIEIERAALERTEKELAEAEAMLAIYL